MQASPQLENGFTRIANEILDHVAKSKLNGTQFKIIMVVWRYTYGFSRKDHEFSLSFLSEATQTDKRQLKRELENLIDKKILLVVKEASFSSSRVLTFNKDFTNWGLNSIEGVDSPTPQGVNLPTPQGVNSPTKKENIKEKYKERNIVPYQEIYDLYLEQKIISHKALTKEMKEAIKKATEKHSIEDIKIAIQRYGQMYHDKKNEYAIKFCKYQWTLKEFMSRTKGISDFLDEGGKWIRYSESGKQKIAVGQSSNVVMFNFDDD